MGTTWRTEDKDFAWIFKSIYIYKYWFVGVWVYIDISGETVLGTKCFRTFPRLCVGGWVVVWVGRGERKSPEASLECGPLLPFRTGQSVFKQIYVLYIYICTYNNCSPCCFFEPVLVRGATRASFGLVGILLGILILCVPFLVAA